MTSKWWAVVLAALMLLAFAGCSNQPATHSSGSDALSASADEVGSLYSDKVNPLKSNSEMVNLSCSPKDSSAVCIDIECEQTDDGCWRTVDSSQYTYKFKLELVGFISDDTLCSMVVLSNREDITFSDAWIAHVGGTFNCLQREQGTIVRLKFLDADAGQRVVVADHPFHATDDGHWQTENGTYYLFKLNLEGYWAAEGSLCRIVVLSNREDITFSEAWNAGGFNMHSGGELEKSQSVIVHWEICKP